MGIQGQSLRNVRASAIAPTEVQFDHAGVVENAGVLRVVPYCQQHCPPSQIPMPVPGSGPCQRILRKDLVATAAHFPLRDCKRIVEPDAVLGIVH